MIPKECKRLAEVDFPIAVVSRHSAREKSIRHGHPSTLHLWWARRPLAACRAMLLALLLPDPCDPHCPVQFKESAHKTLGGMVKVLNGDDGLRKSLLTFIGDVANWDVANNPRWIGIARELVKAAHPEETPLVVDPFAGGGSTPLEALRLGCDAFASDLNPVACLILKVMLEDIPRHGPELADELRRVGKEIKQQAEKELKEFYPDDPDGSKPIAYLWARTVRCEAPNCGAEIPLMRSFWLCKKSNRRRELRSEVIRPKDDLPHVEFEVFEPKSENEIPAGTVSRARATCPCCGVVLPPERVRAQLVAQRGGADVIFDTQGRRIGGAILLAVVTLKPGEQGRHYRPATNWDYQSVWRAETRLGGMASTPIVNGLSAVPDETLPLMSGTFNVPLYGMNRWGDVFSARQKLALVTLARAVAALPERSEIEKATKEMLALVVDRCSDYSSTLCGWHLTRELIGHTFGRQALGMIWDFAEANLWSDSSGNFDGALQWGILTVQSLTRASIAPGQINTSDARISPLPSESCSIWFTDPPYYFAVPYADLSDFFFVWLKRTLPGHPLLRDPFDARNPLTPKDRELCEMARWDPVRYKEKDRHFFENGMRQAFSEGRRILKEDGIGSVIFAHKTTEGWEALLGGMIGGGWTITGSWPLATEMGARLRARESAALATSVHLVCRPRSEDAPVGDWGDVLRELPRRVGDWMERLQSEGIRGADLVFACIGPALEIFSRYRKVETAEGREVKLDEYLEKVWEVVGRTALEQILGTAEARARNGAAGALEEDARLTALFLWTLQSTSGESTANGESDEDSGEGNGDDEDDEAPATSKAKGYSLAFDVARRFAQPLGIALPKWEGRIIETDKGIVRLLSVSERAKQLFGEEGASSVADWLEHDPVKGLQLALLPEMEEAPVPKIRGGKKGRMATSSELELQKDQGATTLDRVHAAMLLQAGGQANALRALIKAEQDRGQDFLRLANALSALYPKRSEEKRLLDAILQAVPR